MKLIIDWEEYDGMYLNAVDVVERGLCSLGVLRDELVCYSTSLLSFNRLLFGGKVIGEIHCRETPDDDAGEVYASWSRFERQLYLEEAFLDIFGKALLEKLIPIYAEEDFFWSYPDCKAFDHRDYLAQSFLKSAEKELREILGLS